MAVLQDLTQVGQVVDSAVGGETCCRNRHAKGLTSVAFWGICDIKYDPRLPKKERVKVLELGDGKSSRFSHHGRPIKEKFDREYCMDKEPPPIKRAVMVENKKFTHDMFDRTGFAHLRPKTASFHRTYKPELAQEIVKRLGLRDDEGLVLKLCNRSRGAGVVVVSSNPQKLDSVLQKLLKPLTGGQLGSWLNKRMETALTDEPLNVLEEQSLHWWSNECPVFIAEQLCSSIPVAMQPGGEKKFDGTMRVAFALHREHRINKLAHMTMWKDAEDVKPFEINWLGGYWKLPRAATEEDPEGNELENMQARVVSSFNSVDKRTAEVPKEQLDEIYEALTPALPVIFHTGAFNVTLIRNLYRNDPLFCAFALARIAATVRGQDLGKAKNLYDLASRYVHPDQKNLDLAECSVVSYIQRNEGVCEAIQGNWDKAIFTFELSQKALPTNSTTHYLIGCYYQESRALQEAITFMMKSIALDPDFKSPYMALGNIHLLQRNWQLAINASTACLRRNPDAPQAQFIIGQAMYHLMFNARGPALREWEAMSGKAVAALEIAKARTPACWTCPDQKMLEYLRSDDRAWRRGQEELPVHTWKVTGWRP